MSGWFARNRHRYPADWDAIARRAKDAAGWRCQSCDAPHGPPPADAERQQMSMELS